MTMAVFSIGTDFYLTLDIIQWIIAEKLIFAWILSSG